MCYIVTPLEDQQALVKRLLSHWCEGIGKDLHPHREQALRRLRTVESIAEAKQDIHTKHEREPVIWATTARAGTGKLSHRRARQSLWEEAGPRLLLLGTAWGLAPVILNEADAVLEGIYGVNGYNHLSVRCAAAILVDRLLSVPE
jgi:hypothetical protein